ncbi:hypothetical protein N0V93_003674 [Gnomoniopsis smithogilvyi]|uniref:Uncharacterized protein n=1 Tax=Gnomoniopsis smithogilvyi TaxID=1191159 RepID=A0A9W8YZ57_9PEZI|nr:hypothetical protein N0V93_003674 [Gnomoniopsis smithogilvyi]
MVDETIAKNDCKAPAPLSPSSPSSRDRNLSKHQGQVFAGRAASADDPDTPSSLAADDFDLDAPSSSPPSQLAPSLSSSFAEEAKAKGKHQAEEGHEIQRALDLIRRHYYRQLREDEVEDLECQRICLPSQAYSRLKEILGQNEDLLAHFENNVRHDYSPQRGCLKLRLMVTPLHETLKTKFIDEIKSQLSSIARRLDDERASIRLSLLPPPDPETDPAQLSDLPARAAALEETVRVIRELEDLSHTTVKLAGGGSACPDGQFRHKKRVPHFVFEIGYSEEATSLRQSAEDYINGTYDVKTVVTVDTAYTREQKRKALLRKQRESRRQPIVESVADAADGEQGLEQEDGEVDEASINRCATLCLYRGTSTIIRDKMIRDRHGTAREGTLTLSLDDFIADDTVAELEALYPYDQETPHFHPSALLLQIPFRQLTTMLEKGDQQQDLQDTTPSPEPEPAAGGRPKRKLCFDVDEDDGTDVSTTTGVKRRRRVIAVGAGRRTRSMGRSLS